nr:hypothetical protein Iba_chr12dCG13280 [Ipomoea batatas]GMD70872.1 hypothetical protein Iba_chr12eCG10530 [Ipomoea batatas]
MAPSKHRHIHYTASTILKSTDSDLNQTNSANAMRLETLDLSGISTEYLEFTRLSSLGCCNYHVCPAPTSPPIPGRVFRRGWSAFTTMPMFGLKSASYCTHKAATAANFATAFGGYSPPSLASTHCRTLSSLSFGNTHVTRLCWPRGRV